MQISIITRGNRKFCARVSRFGQSGAARRFVAFFSEPLGSLIKYFLGVDATAGHIPEFAAAKVPGMFKASERASVTPEISCGQRFRCRHRG